MIYAWHTMGWEGREPCNSKTLLPACILFFFFSSRLDDVLRTNNLQVLNGKRRQYSRPLEKLKSVVTAQYIRNNSRLAILFLPGKVTK